MAIDHERSLKLMGNAPTKAVTLALQEGRKVTRCAVSVSTPEEGQRLREFFAASIRAAHANGVDQGTPAFSLSMESSLEGSKVLVPVMFDTFERMVQFDNVTKALAAEITNLRSALAASTGAVGGLAMRAAGPCIPVNLVLGEGDAKTQRTVHVRSKAEVDALQDYISIVSYKAAAEAVPIVEVRMPVRETKSTVKRDREGNIQEVTQVESSVEKAD